MAVTHTRLDGPSSIDENQLKNGTSTSTDLPLVIAGGGCVGLFLALLVALADIPNRIIVIEPEQPDPIATRAMAHQPPTYPILSRAPGLLPELIKAGSLSAGLCFRTSVATGSKVIAGKRFDNSGEGMKGKGQLLLPQGKFQEVLMKRMEKLKDKVEIRLGFKVVDVTTNPTSVTVKIQQENEEEQELEAAYLVGADGGHSLVRKHLGVAFEGETLDAQLVATDLHFDFHAHGFYDANFILDPENYGLIGRISHSSDTASSSDAANLSPSTSDGRALWRVSYGVPLGISEQEIRENIDEKLAFMLPNAGLDKDGKPAYDVVRIAPYKAQQRIASTLYTNRVMLVGDAAHLTNPYAGLGLASGMADASSLAEVLGRVLSRKAADPEELLRAWSDARRQKFLDVVDKPSRMAYKRVRSDVSTEEKLEALLGRDPMVGALKSGMPVMPPSLETRGDTLAGW